MKIAEHRARVAIAFGLMVIGALLLVAWERRWLSSEPSFRGRTVTEWLDKLVLYEYQQRPDGTWKLGRARDAILQDPAYEALMKIGSNGIPVLSKVLSQRAEWPPEMSGIRRSKRWMEWQWHRLRGSQVSRPAPLEWSEAQTARKTAAGFVLVGLGTNGGGGFSKYMEVYASAPKRQTVYGTRVAGPPVGLSSLDVVRNVISVMPQRREEVIGEVLAALEHTNAWCRVVALDSAHAFREELLRRRKQYLVNLTQDEDPLVQVAALENLLLIVANNTLTDLMPADEIAQVAQQALDDPQTSNRIARFLARKVLNLATNQ